MKNNTLLNLLKVAYQMLMHGKRQFIGMLIGSTFAAFIIMQQPGIYQGISDRIVSQIRAIPEADLWVMTSYSKAFNTPSYFDPYEIFHVRSIPGVEWAISLFWKIQPFYQEKADQSLGWEEIGVDANTLIGLPKTLVAGNREAIRRFNGLIIDGYSVKLLEKTSKQTLNLGSKLKDDRGKEWLIVGITKPMRTYSVTPIAYVTSNHISNIHTVSSFILVKVAPGTNVQSVADLIRAKTGLDVLTQEEFVHRALTFFRTKTPILIIFVCIAVLGFFIGLIIMWQIFSNFIFTHLHQYGMLKMLGVSNRLLMQVVFFQSSIVGIGGFLIGLFLVMLFGLITHDTLIAFRLTKEIVFLGLLGTIVITIIATYFSIRRVMTLDSVELCRDSH